MVKYMSWLDDNKTLLYSTMTWKAEDYPCTGASVHCNKSGENGENPT